MDFLRVPKKWDKKHPTSDMNDGDYVTWEKEREIRSTDDADFWLSKRRIRPLGLTRKRIWPPPSQERE